MEKCSSEHAGWNHTTGGRNPGLHPAVDVRGFSLYTTAHEKLSREFTCASPDRPGLVNRCRHYLECRATGSAASGGITGWASAPALVRAGSRRLGDRRTRCSHDDGVSASYDDAE